MNEPSPDHGQAQQIEMRPAWKRWLGVCGCRRCLTGDLDQVWLRDTQAWRCEGCYGVWRDDPQSGGVSRYERMRREARRQRLAAGVLLGAAGLIGLVGALIWAG